MERCENIGSRSMPKPYPSVCGDTTEDINIEFYGVSQRKKQYNAI